MEFHFLHVLFLGMNHCLKELHGLFKCRRKNHDVLWLHDYAEWIGYIFIIKYNLNTMAEIVLYPLKELY